MSKGIFNKIHYELSARYETDPLEKTRYDKKANPVFECDYSDSGTTVSKKPIIISSQL